MLRAGLHRVRLQLQDQVGSPSVEVMEPGQTSDKTTKNVVGPAAIFICKDQHLILFYLPQNVT